MSNKKAYFEYSVDDKRPFLQLRPYAPEYYEYYLQHCKEKDKREEKEGKRVIIIDMVSPDTPVCQIDLQ